MGSHVAVHGLMFTSPFMGSYRTDDPARKTHGQAAAGGGGGTSGQKGEKGKKVRQGKGEKKCLKRI